MNKTQAYTFKNSVGLRYFLRIHLVKLVYYPLHYSSCGSFIFFLVSSCVGLLSLTFLFHRPLHFLLAQKTKQKRAPFPDPSARKAKGQPRGKRKANAPAPPSTIEGNTTLFVAYLFLSQ
ncbi:hypothetical protein QNI16_19440 [Cytophagaceae bacterium YF14B1]|uniref:Uncharacterized protein n=1 Tax=Xanthocytophaga flava TaxID=3048013 RepID=A0AAE3QSN2_9BACT|nr:hypothetical protein [Xanthocytophaga flavus]